MSQEVQFTLQKIEKRLELITPLSIRQRIPLGVLRYFEHKGVLDPERVEPDIDDSEWTTIEPNTYWGQWNVNFTLRGEFSVPMELSKSGPIGLEFALGQTPGWDFCHPETLLYIDGEPVSAVDRNHTLVNLPTQFIDGKVHQIALYGYTGRWGVYDKVPPNRLLMETNAVVQIDQPTRDFIATARVAVGTVKRISVDNPVRGKLLQALDNAFKALNLMHPMGDDFYNSVGPAHRLLKEQIQLAGTPLDVTVNAIGHSHIDVAWLWTLAQTRRKCGRTFHTVLALMDEFEDYCFSQSQPQLFDYVKQDSPDLFAAIQEKVKQGRWEILGGMWVEADCNLSGAESLARQFLLGRRFFAEHFGPDAESPILWLPDVFGYCANLPQLMKQAGLDYFFTSKLAWNQYNRMPYDTFLWKGLDGSEVLTHFLTTCHNVENKRTDYSGTNSPNEIYNTWASVEPKELHSELMTCYGYSDGGGGPTREMLENARELKHCPGMPKVRLTKAIDHFKRLEASCGDRLPVWNGELYLEYHRGTYTTHARNKRANRKSEFGMHNAEFLGCLAALLDERYSYPKQELNQAWELVCLNQFHDIVPGSSISEVYVDSLEQYDHVRQIFEEAISDAAEVISRNSGGDVILINPTSFGRNDLSALQLSLKPDQQLQMVDGDVVSTQHADEGTMLIDTPKMPPYSVVPLKIVQAPSPSSGDSGLKVKPDLLENDFLKVVLNADGDIVRIFDKKNNRDIVPDGSLANQILAFEDRPLNWDAWDIDIFYEDKVFYSEPAESVEVIEAGPLRATLEIKRKILNSRYSQKVSLAYNSPRLDISTSIDWQERHILLKAAFPLDIFSAEASFEVQWGHVKRPTHRNTSWDWARFESCAHKWVDLSEDDYGVTVMNDCKYGHDVKDNVIRITLLRSPVMPDPGADSGCHQFDYSLYPHTGPVGEDSIAQAYAFNNPLLTSAPKQNVDTDPMTLEFIRTDKGHVVIETVKKAEDGNGFIVRLYESLRRRGPVTLSTGFPIEKCCRVNLLEENLDAVAFDDKEIQLDIKPFEIVSLRIIPHR